MVLDRSAARALCDCEWAINSIRFGSSWVSGINKEYSFCSRKRKSSRQGARERACRQWHWPWGVWTRSIRSIVRDAYRRLSNDFINRNFFVHKRMKKNYEFIHMYCMHRDVKRVHDYAAREKDWVVLNFFCFHFFFEIFRTDYQLRAARACRVLVGDSIR